MIISSPKAHESNCQQILIDREVNMVEPTVPSLLKWSESAITFDQSEHPIHVPFPRQFPIVVSLIMGKVRLTKVLMDGKSGINILYTETLNRMKISRSKLRLTKLLFYGVVSGK